MERSLSRSDSCTEKDPTSAVNQLHALGPPILLLSSDTTASPAGKRQLPKISLADTSNHVLVVVLCEYLHSDYARDITRSSEAKLH